MEIGRTQRTATIYDKGERAKERKHKNRRISITVSCRLGRSNSFGEISAAFRPVARGNFAFPQSVDTSPFTSARSSDLGQGELRVVFRPSFYPLAGNRSFDYAETSRRVGSSPGPKLTDSDSSREKADRLGLNERIRARGFKGGIDRLASRTL